MTGTALHPLDHVGSQRVFRVLLDALSRPGTIGALPTELLGAADAPAALLVPLALADLEVTLGVLEPAGAGWAGALAAATGARPAPAEEADLVLALRAPRPDEVRGLRRGTPDRPDRACRLVLSCAALGPEGDVRCALTGPGVDGAAELGVGGLPVETVEALVAVNRAFPLGVDAFVVAADGRVAGLPRSTRVRVRAGAGSWGRS
ncbi:phosphonate C-P lyase system protein PhnH [Pseudonocardia kunmingensis]|uniref:Alpha-D-ribose 1-methylphosphonate 5-triphosphate synthase subunit PhnH n=1 Tax=Pseudonocardia kunmingensis TaxID=630975 RepID=A0A543D3X5_9PSEU|nr:phosphonate C-P lyase system protein PhnH [Pseudonocardia kunmingensis]TQM04035.1 alpha-D-ribose 1-methylphosphonate 5-triphosphate synthase subunit PhnH [Pseudonocardia kunmingensis]